MEHMRIFEPCGLLTLASRAVFWLDKTAQELSGMPESGYAAFPSIDPFPKVVLRLSKVILRINLPSKQPRLAANSQQAANGGVFRNQRCMVGYFGAK